jgi:monoamine oxidase
VPDVLVLGAGYAGLTAASVLADAGVDVLLIEARDRVGGRCHTERFPDGSWIDMGGQWVGPTQRKLRALAAKHRIATFPTHDRGEAVDLWQGVSSRYTGPLPTSDPEALGDAVAAILDLDLAALEVPLHAPWLAPDADARDGETFQSWIDREVDSEGGRAQLTLACQAIWSAEPRDLSLLHVQFYLRSSGGMMTLLGVEGGAQDSRFVGGAMSTAEAMASALGHHLVLGAPARRVIQDEQGVRVETDRGTFSAGHVIVCLPPTLAGRLAYDPPLPGYRDQLTQRVPMGTVIKCHAVYDTPFWRADGLSGRSTADTGAVRVAFDNSPPDGSRGILMGFVEGEEGRRLGRLAPEVRRREVLACFAAFVGPEALEPQAFHERSWADEEFSRGCYAGLFGPGTWTSYGEAVRAPIGRIHWAGTESATVWTGYMDGAVQSGERAAFEVCDLLGIPRPAALPESGGPITNEDRAGLPRGR